jgi:hypothetical protein
MKSPCHFFSFRGAFHKKWQFLGLQVGCSILLCYYLLTENQIFI